jgi:hypothetical protein
VHRGIFPHLCECHRPFIFARPTTATTATPERELPLTNAVDEFDAGNRDGFVIERLKPRHRRTASLNRPMILLNQIIEIFIRTHPLNNAGIKAALAVNRVKGDWLRRSTPQQMVRAFYPMPRIAPEPVN